MPGSADRKHEVRAWVREQRAARDEADQRSLGIALTEQLSALVTALGAASLTCFLPARGEPDTRPFLSWARAHHIDTLLPSARPDGLLDWIRPSDEGTVSGLFGISEPLGEFMSPLAAHEVDLMLIPAAAVDRQGVRLGWGRGYFDRMLASMEGRPPVFAVVYDEEVFDELPSEAHDFAVTGVVTPTSIHRFPVE